MLAGRDGQMQIDKESLSKRHDCLRFFKTPLRLTRLTELEITDHLILLSSLHNRGNYPYSSDVIDKCRERFINFCQHQFKNRN